MSHLEVSGLGVRYGAVRALHDVTLDVGSGESVALLGANGAGKTTVLRAIGGLLAYQGGSMVSGDIRFEGRSTSRADASALVAGGIAQALEGRRVFAELTVAENLRIGAFAARGPRREGAVRDELLELFPILRERIDQRAGLLSGGQQQMLAIARALMAAPRLLLLDEPSLGLSPILVKEIFAIIKRVNEEQGMSILLVEQNAKVALETAHYGYVLEIGRVVMNDTCERLMSSKDIQEFYLGAKEEGARGERRWKKKKTWR
jgi:branched-chain amino acid transport system ATP-binding protein